MCRRATISPITEMEYNRAVERGIPRLIFLIHSEHPVKAGDVEKGEGAPNLEGLNSDWGTNASSTFQVPGGLRANVINSLSRYRHPDVTAFHYVSDIPAPPEAYIAHPYTLLQSKGLVGRQAELNVLTDWVAKPGAEVYPARILNVVAIGGMGKSALTWKWFNDIAPQEMKPLAGRMWWSFYESDASFENFVTRALAYVTRRPREEVEKIPPPERESQLLAALDREPYLIVLDGLERILIAYARMDAAHLAMMSLKGRLPIAWPGPSACRAASGRFRPARPQNLGPASGKIPAETCARPSITDSGQHRGFSPQTLRPRVRQPLAGSFQASTCRSN